MHEDTMDEQLARNSFGVPELMYRNDWSRNYVYSLIARGILVTYKDGRRRRASADAERAAISYLEKITSGGA